MFKCIITLIFSTNFMVSIYVEPADIILQNAETSRSVAAQNLGILSHDEALPITLFTVGYIPTGIQVMPPEDIVEAWIEDGKMVKGTKFSLWDLQSPIFYCPRPYDPNACLVPQEFNDSDQLKCSQEPVPFPAQDFNFTCNRGTPNSMFYNICEDGGDSQGINAFFQMYGFCFDAAAGDGKTLYTSHYILSPKLLKSNLLLREQQLSYRSRFMYYSAYHTANLDALQNALYWESPAEEDVGNEDQALNPQYQVQLLVPKEDMAVGFWIKAAFQYHNAELQHKDLFDLWNKINKRVRVQVIQRYEYGFIYHIRTGVFDLELPPNQFGQIYNMWVKLIVCESMVNPQQQKQGVIILMNNFINVDNPPAIVEMLQNKIDDYCPRNRCARNFMEEVASVRGAVVRCCRLDSSNLEFFGLENDQSILNAPLVPIRGLV